MLTRRQFAGGAAMSLAAAGWLRANPLGLPIGFQTYPVQKMIGQDFEGTLRQMAGMGFKTLEMCSPPGYGGSGFGPLQKLTAAEMRKKIEDAGLSCNSCHYQFKELKENLDDRIAFAKGLGLKQMVLSAFGVRQDAKMSDWTQAAEELNKIGEKTLKAGIQMAFHNHHMEFREIDGVLVYDQLLRTFDPKLVKLQFQVAVINLGYKAATYMTKYPGRFASLHLADWSDKDKKQVPVGQGVVDWKELFAAAKKGGVKNYFVEMDLNLMKDSVPYLQKLKV